MQAFYINLSQWVSNTADNIWQIMVPILFLVGAWMTYKTGFIQFKRLGAGLAKNGMVMFLLLLLCQQPWQQPLGMETSGGLLLLYLPEARGQYFGCGYADLSEWPPNTQKHS